MPLEQDVETLRNIPLAAGLPGPAQAHRLHRRDRCASSPAKVIGRGTFTTQSTSSRREGGLAHRRSSRPVARDDEPASLFGEIALAGRRTPSGQGPCDVQDHCPALLDLVPLSPGSDAGDRARGGRRVPSGSGASALNSRAWRPRRRRRVGAAARHRDEAVRAIESGWVRRRLAALDRRQPYDRATLSLRRSQMTRVPAGVRSVLDGLEDRGLPRRAMIRRGAACRARGDIVPGSPDSRNLAQVARARWNWPDLPRVVAGGELSAGATGRPPAARVGGAVVRGCQSVAGHGRGRRRITGALSVPRAPAGADQLPLATRQCRASSSLRAGQASLIKCAAGLSRDQFAPDRQCESAARGAWAARCAATRGG
jgi:hypothetical protein